MDNDVIENYLESEHNELYISNTYVEGSNYFINNFPFDHYPFIKPNLVIQLLKSEQYLLAHYLNNYDLQNLAQ